MRKWNIAVVLAIIIATILIVWAQFGVHFLEKQDKYNEFWGKETYEKYVKIQGQQIQEMIKGYDGNAVVDQSVTAEKKTNNLNTDLPKLTQEEMKDILSDQYVIGNKDAKIAIVEYSNVWCPFCQKHRRNKTLESIQEDDDDIQVIIKFNEGFHPNNTQGVMCAGEIGWANGYYDFFDALLEDYNSENTKEQLTAFAEKIGLDTKDFETCLDTSFQKIYSKNTLESQRFGISGTPWHLIINTQTGEYVTDTRGAVPWTYILESIAKIK